MTAELRPDLALCRDPGADPDWWFARQGPAHNAAKARCGSCPVAAACLETALTLHPVQGLWAGTSLRQREQLHQARLTAAVLADPLTTALPEPAAGLTDCEVRTR